MVGVALLSHGHHQSTDHEKVRVPVHGGTDRVSHGRAGGSTLVHVDTRSEIREFLTSRRGRGGPDQRGRTASRPPRRPRPPPAEGAGPAGPPPPHFTPPQRGAAPRAPGG